MQFKLSSNVILKKWISGNIDIDKIVQDTQLSAHHDVKEALEWVPYDRFTGINLLGKVCKAN